MVRERNHWVWRGVNAVAREVLARGASGPFMRNLVVNEYPKSGGTWLSQMLAEATRLPFPMHRLPLARPQLLQGHYLRPSGIRNVVVLWRDGRDVLVSLYYHRVVGNEYSLSSRTRELRERLGISDPLDLSHNFPRFVESSFVRPISPHFTWPEFVNTWSDRPGVSYTRYEALISNATDEIRRLVEERGYARVDELQVRRIVDRFSFENRRSDLDASSDSSATTRFVRKGVVGDWRNHFTHEVAQVFDHYAGEALLRLGYESDGSWVDACGTQPPNRLPAGSAA